MADIIKILCSISPEKLQDLGRKNLLPAFRRAAKTVPAYQEILKKNNVDFEKVRNLESFQSLVPIIDKEDIFPVFDIDKLCVKNKFKEIKSVLASSGYSGIYAFGLNTAQDLLTTRHLTDLALDYTFCIHKKKTLLINCLPMGVRVETALASAETSTRSDIALAIIKKISPKFAQTLILGDPNFLKKLVEEGCIEKINWQKLNISLILGQDWFSESLRSYLANLIDLDNPPGRLIGSTMGLTELGLNIFHESLSAINIRRKIQEDNRLRKTLFGDKIKVPPIIFHYYPTRVFLETLKDDSGEQELVFSMLNPDLIMPLIRYNSHDTGWIFSYNQMQEILTNSGYSNLIPELKLPLACVAGRKGKFLEVQGKRVYPEEIKQGLYEDFTIAGLTTGYFKLNNSGNSVEIQLKKGITITEELKSKFKTTLLKYSAIDLPVILYHYQDFPYAMELDYERKFVHL